MLDSRYNNGESKTSRTTVRRFQVSSSFPGARPGPATASAPVRRTETAPLRSGASDMLPFDSIRGGNLASLPNGTAERAGFTEEEARRLVRVADTGDTNGDSDMVDIMRLLRAGKEIADETAERARISTKFLNEYLAHSGGRDVDQSHRCTTDCRPFKQLAPDMFGCLRSGHVHTCGNEACTRVAIPYRGSNGSHCLFSEKMAFLHLCNEWHPQAKRSNEDLSFGDDVDMGDEKAPGDDGDDGAEGYDFSLMGGEGGEDVLPHSAPVGSPGLAGAMRNLTLASPGAQVKRMRYTPSSPMPSVPASGIVFTSPGTQAISGAGSPLLAPPASPGWGAPRPLSTRAPPNSPTMRATRSCPDLALVGMPSPRLASASLRSSSPAYGSVSPLAMPPPSSRGSSPSFTPGASINGMVLTPEGGSSGQTASPLVRTSAPSPKVRGNSISPRPTSGLARSGGADADDESPRGLRALESREMDGGMTLQRQRVLSDSLLDAVLWNTSARLAIFDRDRAARVAKAQAAVDAAVAEAARREPPVVLETPAREAVYNETMRKMPAPVMVENEEPGHRDRLFSVLQRAWRVYCSAMTLPPAQSQVESTFLTFCYGCLYRMGTHDVDMPLIGVDNHVFLPADSWLRPRLMSLGTITEYHSLLGITPTINGLIQPPPTGRSGGSKGKRRGARKPPGAEQWRLMHTKAGRMVIEAMQAFRREFGDDCVEALHLLKLRNDS